MQMQDTNQYVRKLKALKFFFERFFIDFHNRFLETNSWSAYKESSVHKPEFLVPLKGSLTV